MCKLQMEAFTHLIVEIVMIVGQYGRQLSFPSEVSQSHFSSRQVGVKYPADDADAIGRQALEKAFKGKSDGK